MTVTPSLVFVALVPFIAWRLYARYRKMVSRQHSRPWRHWAAAIFFSSVLLLLAVTSLVHPMAEVALAGGIAAGAVLSHFGLRSTRFEATPEGVYFTPNARIGITLIALLVARILYRFYEISTVQLAPRSSQMQDFTRSPLTLALVGMLLAYYIAYAIGILRWRRAHAGDPAPPGGTP
jgi:cytochrome b561